MSVDLTKLVGFNFNGLEVSSVDIDTAADDAANPSLNYVPGSTTYNVVASGFVGNNADNGVIVSSVIEQVTAASNGTQIDGTPLTNPLAIGQIVYNDVVNGSASPSNTYDVLGISADGSSLLVALASSYNNGPLTDPYGLYNVISDADIDGNATPSLFPTATQTFTSASNYVGGPFTKGGVAADLVSLTSTLVNLHIPSNSITTTTSSTGVVQNADGSYTVKQTNVVLATGAGTFTVQSGGVGAQGQSTLKFAAAGGTSYFQVVGFNSTQILLESVSATGAPLGQPRYSILSISNQPPQSTNVSINFNNYGIAPLAGQAYPCFVSGTRIAIPGGSALVEQLQPGDTVLTASGNQATVVWVGRATVQPGRGADAERVRPVCIEAGAVADQVPSRDLLLSPDHAVFLDDLLIPVKQLINGTTIRQVDRRVVEYVHIELAQHDVLLAEGLPSESYLDSGNRAALQGGGIIAGGPGAAELNYMIWETLGFRQLTLSGDKLRAVRERLAARSFDLRQDTAA